MDLMDLHTRTSSLALLYILGSVRVPAKLGWSGLPGPLSFFEVCLKRAGKHNAVWRESTVNEDKFGDEPGRQLVLHNPNLYAEKDTKTSSSFSERNFESFAAQMRRKTLCS